MDTYQSLKTHLDKFTDIITSVNHPYGLHRAREERFFKGDVIVSLRKSPNRPSFTYVDFDCYVSATFYLIKSNRFDLKFITGFLNSKLIAFWLKNKGKMQGQNFQIDKEPLVTIPIFIPDQETQEIIRTSVEEIYSNPSTQQQNEKIIDEMIYKMYALDDDEIAYVEQTIV